MTLRKCCFEKRIEFMSSVVKKIVVLRRELDIDLKKCLRDETYRNEAQIHLRTISGHTLHGPTWPMRLCRLAPSLAAPGR